MQKRSLPPRQTAREVVADFLRTQIVDGSLPPESKLNIGDIADQLGVSPTPAREAVQQLAVENLVQLDAFKGARVAELSADEYEEICAMRVGLEGLAARLGTTSIDDAGIKQMRSALKRMERAASADNVDAFVEADRAFHEAHYTASGRESLWRRIIGLRYAAERYTRLAYRVPGVGMEDTLRTHTALMDAVVARKPAQTQAMIEKDLRTTAATVTKELRSVGEGGQLKRARG
jgi:DNA-binding GntR family transcriptional regulator